MPVTAIDRRVDIYKAWIESGGKMSYTQLARMFDIDARTAKNAVLEGEKHHELMQGHEIMANGKPDLPKLKERAWMNIIRQVYDGDMATSKWVVGLDEQEHSSKKRKGEEAEKEAKEAGETAEAFGL